MLRKYFNPVMIDLTMSYPKVFVADGWFCLLHLSATGSCLRLYFQYPCVMDIPRELRNSETGELLANCLVCKKDVLQVRQPYFLEKIVRNVRQLGIREVLFEYAMCADCAEMMRQQLSKESIRQLQAYMEEHQHPATKQNLEHSEAPELDRCAISDQLLDECSEFAYHAVCIGESLHPMFSPYAISSAVMDALGDRLSNETLDALDDFKGRYFTGPPEVARLISPKRLISI